MGETRVDLLHLLEDLRDAYPGATEETILTEIVANALDSGTAVRLTPANALSPLVDAGFVEGALRRNFQPLFDPALADVLRPQYPRGVTFTVNGRGLESHAWRAQDVAPLAIRVARKRKPAGAGYLTRDTAPLAEELRGVAVSTYGKVIKRGWDWLGVASAGLECIGGLMEVPALAEC